MPEMDLRPDQVEQRLTDIEKRLNISRNMAATFGYTPGWYLYDVGWLMEQNKILRERLDRIESRIRAMIGGMDHDAGAGAGAESHR